MMFRGLVCIIALGCAAFMIAGCTKNNNSLQPGETIENIAIIPECANGRIHAEWKVPAGMEDLEETITLYDFYAASDGNSAYEAFDEFTVSGGYQDISNAVAYHYQETGIDTDTQKPMLAVGVDIYKDGAKTASGISYSINVADFFPPEQGPEIGKDLTEENITGLEWSSSGMAADSFFHFSVSFDETPAVLYGNYYDVSMEHEKELELDEESRQRFMDLILTGKICREYAEDPHLEILDGGEEYFRLLWQDMRDCDRSWYRICFSQENRQQIEDLFHELVSYRGE